MSEVVNKAKQAKGAAQKLNIATTEQKNDALRLMAKSLINEQEALIAANELDIQNGRNNGLTEALLDRLRLNEQRITSMADGLLQVVDLVDPVGDVLEELDRPNGLHIRKLRVPLGVVGMIYEARPNVTVDAAGLCLKTGNAVILRGGSAALQSNRKIIEVLHRALEQSAIPASAIQLIESSDRSSVNEMLKLKGLIDVIIPRGGSSLIQNVIQNATVPAIETGAGVCHTYIDRDAEKDMAIKIAINAKAQRPSVCNAMETLLIDHSFAEQHILELAKRLEEANVELRGCDETLKLIPSMKAASAEDWSEEYNDYILAIKITRNIDEALEHIQQYSTMHSECIVTQNQAHADRFLSEVDAAAIYHNASTRFSDGAEFGLGAEIGISTQKLHARGPMGLVALTSTKYTIMGTGQIRQ